MPPRICAWSIWVHPEGSPASVKAAAVPTPLGLLARVAGRLGSLTPGIPTSWLWRAASTSRCYMAR
jgi:hypothetical protein